MRNITISEGIKQEIAERVVEQAHPGYDSDYMGQWYVVNGTAVVHAQRNRPWNPWNDDDDVIGVEDLVNVYGGADDEHAVFDMESEEYDNKDHVENAVAFALGYVPDNYDADDWNARWSDERNMADADYDYGK